MEYIDCAQDPRVIRTRESVLASARELLLTRGWTHVTVGAVAEHSGYARSTLYRQWPNRLDLLRDAISEQARLTHAVPCGNLRDDLIAELNAFVVALTSTGLGHMIAAIVHMARTDTEFADLNRSVQIEGTRVIRDILRAATDSSLLNDTMNADLAIALLVGPITHRFLFEDHRLDGDFVVAVVDGFLARQS
ncbi:MAG: TetR/AcrR family transcriptional regulator [Acidimicrobiales bacterium]